MTRLFDRTSNCINGARENRYMSKRLKFENLKFWRQKMIIQRFIPILTLVLCQDFGRSDRQDIEALSNDDVDFNTECP